ncbi:MAG TPA: hypothetical protein VMQ45_13730, partial [Burkholderiaceae bacterium]|nr:hypothetical protein [Burkholderiaceae bacterium]
MARKTRLAELLLGALGIVTASTAFGGEAAGAPRPIVLKAAHLFDSLSGKLVDRGVVVVAGSRIQAVGSDAQIPPEAQVFDLGDATLLPGFIDAHVHLGSASSNNWYA